MNVKPASGYYDFSISVDGDNRFIANRVEVGVCLGGISVLCYSAKQLFICLLRMLYGIFSMCFSGTWIGFWLRIMTRLVYDQKRFL